MTIAEDLRRIGSQQAGCLTTEAGEVWHPANTMLPAADELDALAARLEGASGLLRSGILPLLEGMLGEMPDGLGKQTIALLVKRCRNVVDVTADSAEAGK